MKSKFLTEQNLVFEPKVQSFLFADNAVDEIAERLAKEIEGKNYKLADAEYAYRYLWNQDRKAKTLETQITLFLPTLNNLLEEYFSLRNTSLGTSLNALNFIFCFTARHHYRRPFGMSFIRLLDDDHEKVEFKVKEFENEMIGKNLGEFRELYYTFRLESVVETSFNSTPFWDEVLRIYITDVINFIKNHRVFKILGDITNTEVALGRNEIGVVEDFFTFNKYFGTKFEEKYRLPGKFSDSYMAVSSRNHLLSPGDHEYGEIVEKFGISEETLSKIDHSTNHSVMSLSDDDMDSIIDSEDQKEMSEESASWSDALTPRQSRRSHSARVSSSRNQQKERELC